MVHYEKGEVASARRLYERVLKIDDTEGADDTEDAEGDGNNETLPVATDLNNLGLLLKNQGLLEEAEPHLRRALAIKENLFEPGHPSLVTGLRNYASLLRALDREDEAAELDIRLG